jgi:hypothetical protein
MGKTIRDYRLWLREAFDEPKSKSQLIVTLVSMAAVILSIIHIAFTSENPEMVTAYGTAIDGIEWGFTIFFTLEILLRIFAKPRPRDYMLSPFGIIDILAVAPTWLSLFFPGLPNTSWLRALRLIRLLRIVEVLRRTPGLSSGGYGLLLQLAPFMAYAFILKTIIVILEGAGYWYQITGLSLILPVIGFAIGVLLSTRLGTLQSRMYDFEVNVAKLAATVRIIRDGVPDVNLLNRFTLCLQRYSQGECNNEEPQQALEAIAAAGPGSVGAPIWVNFHQTAQFSVERLGVLGTSEYTRVLRNVIVIYIIALLLVVPGLTGLLSAALVVYVLGGMFMLILNMERPYSPDEDSLMDADLEPLFRLNRQIEAGMNMAERQQVVEGSSGDVRGEKDYQPAN